MGTTRKQFERIYRAEFLGLRPYWPVFGTSMVLVVLLSALGLTFSDRLELVLTTVRDGIIATAGWFYILTVNLVLGLVVYLLFSTHGGTRIGGPNAKPEFTRASWLVMLFAAGMGVGLYFNGVFEPISLYANPAWGEGQTPESAQLAMGFTYLHWGFHPWAVYALVGLALAFFVANRDLPLTIRSVFHPLAGRRIWGWLGTLVDVIAIVATLFGVATALGLGAQQLNAGLAGLFGVPIGPLAQVALIAAITALATTSVAIGLEGGIRRLSFVAIGLSLAFLALIFVMGPTAHLLDALVENLGFYIGQFPRLSTWTGTYQEGSDWRQNWTLAYWAWWISWSPFVGVFIARISIGRTVREFLLGVLLVPALASIVWFTILGGTALDLQMRGAGGLIEAIEQSEATSLFALLDQFPLRLLTSLLAMLGVAIFFVTSSDSGALVLDIIASGGDPNPARPSRILWAVLVGVVASVLLLGGGLQVLRSAVLIAGLPFTAVLLMMGVSLVRGLRAESEKQT